MPFPLTFHIPVSHICFAWQVIHGNIATASKLHIVTDGLISDIYLICDKTPRLDCTTSTTALGYSSSGTWWTNHLLVPKLSDSISTRSSTALEMTAGRTPQPRKPTATVVIALWVIFHANTEAVYDKHPVIVSVEAMLARFNKKIVSCNGWGSCGSEIPRSP
ncbi:hypothetical protein GQ42DRAFT_159717 [Ramicandelaber brevisporus]|nr:hypothetical protein GQ42DRAFT_159717 [Ramicandelaber brevisporus]